MRFLINQHVTAAAKFNSYSSKSPECSAASNAPLGRRRQCHRHRLTLFGGPYHIKIYIFRRHKRKCAEEDVKRSVRDQAEQYTEITRQGSDTVQVERLACMNGLGRAAITPHPCQSVTHPAICATPHVCS